jgi:U3 small nucleolar RNA-associated protein 6
MNLDNLRKKRVKRLGVRTKSFLGSRRINFIFERGTRRFHGDVGLWLQYIEYIRKENSLKLLKKVLNECVLLPLPSISTDSLNKIKKKGRGMKRKEGSFCC